MSDDDAGWGGAGCIAAGWFDVVLATGAVALAWPVVSLASLGCPSGGPGCGPMLALATLFGWAIGLGAVFTTIVLGLGWLGRRWAVGIVGMAILGSMLIAIPAVALIRALSAGDAWLIFGATAFWLIVPGVSILADVRSMWRRRGSTRGRLGPDV